jgi:fructose/tagatose bisphosphate aldolase
MAPAVGTVHGFFKGEPQFNWDVINSLEYSKYNYVLHGCTGLELKEIRKFSELGFVKFNFATVLREVFRGAMLKYIDENEDSLKPYLYLNSAQDALSKYMEEIFELFED